MNQNDADFESTFTRARKRMLPSVAEVARELSNQTMADAAGILSAARRVCAEELARVKNGQESAPVEVLVERARKILDEAPQEAPAGAPAPVAAPKPFPPLPEGSDPFGETSGKLDLKWDPESGVPPKPSAASFHFPDDLAAHQGPGPSAPKPGAGPEAPSPFAFNLDAPFSPASEAPEPVSRTPLTPARARRSRLPLVVAAMAIVVAVGGGVWYLLLGKHGLLTGPPPPPLTVAKRHPPRRPPSSGPEVQATPAAPASLAAAPAESPAAAVPSDEKKAVAVQESAPQPTPAAPAAVKEGGPPAPVSVVLRASPEAAGAAPSARDDSRAMAPPQARAGALVTPDWSGEPVFVLHFSSFTDRKTAERDAARLGKEMALPARAVQVDLGEKGIWYRAVVGEFGSVQEAIALRNDLREKKTPGVGLVYRMTAKK